MLCLSRNIHNVLQSVNSIYNRGCPLKLLKNKVIEILIITYLIIGSTQFINVDLASLDNIFNFSINVVIDILMLNLPQKSHL